MRYTKNGSVNKTERAEQLSEGVKWAMEQSGVILQGNNFAPSSKELLEEKIQHDTEQPDYYL